MSRAIRLLAVLFLFLASTAQAQLLSNLGSVVSGSYGGGPDSASIFTTGAVPITINRVDVLWNIGGVGGNSVGIFTDNAGVPSTTQVGTSFTSAGPTVAGTQSYTGGNAVLAPATTYWMVVITVDGSLPSWTGANVVASSPSTAGAAMPPGSTFGNVGTGVWINDGVNLMFALFGTAAATGPSNIPTLQEWAILLLAAMMLGVAFSQRKRIASSPRSAPSRRA